MNKEERQNIIDIIIRNEKLRPLKRLERLLRVPGKTAIYYVLAFLSHIRPYKISFPTLWGTRMTSFLPEGNTFYYYGYCEANVTNFLLRTIKEGDVVVDVGAHIGFYSMLSSVLVGGKGTVHSFEPTPWTYTLLSENTKKLKNVNLHNAAVSDSEGSVTFTDYGPGYGAYNTAHEGGAVLTKKGKVVTVTTIALDAYCKERSLHPTFIKLDAEGYEYAILQGMHHIFETSRPLITLEVAGGVEWSLNRDKSIDFLIQKKYVAFEIDVKGFVKKHEPKQTYVYDNLLFIPEEKIKDYENQ